MKKLLSQFDLWNEIHYENSKEEAKKDDAEAATSLSDTGVKSHVTWLSS